MPGSRSYLSLNLANIQRAVHHLVKDKLDRLSDHKYTINSNLSTLVMRLFAKAYLILHFSAYSKNNTQGIKPLKFQRLSILILILIHLQIYL
jgi:hypothetical protein